MTMLVLSRSSPLKTEKLYLEKPQNLEQARSQITEYILFYNKERFKTNWATSPRLSFGRKSPLNKISFYCLLDGAMTRDADDASLFLYEMHQGQLLQKEEGDRKQISTGDMNGGL